MSTEATRPMTPPVAEKAPAKPTSYTVLREVEPFQGDAAPQVAYAILGEFSGSSASAARQKAFESLGEGQQVGGAILVAVPTRSWVPKRRELVSTPRSVES